MEWYNIIVLIVGAFGGITGLVAAYKAKPEKTSIEVDNMKKMLEEAHSMYDESRSEYKELRQEFTDYKKENMAYVADFKRRFAKLENRLDKAELAIMQGYTCPFIKTAKDCPVLTAHEADCDGCEHDAEGHA